MHMFSLAFLLGKYIYKKNKTAANSFMKFIAKW